MNSKIEMVKKRAHFMKLVRTFFSSKEYLEVETPVLSPYLLPEPAIECFKTEYWDGYGGKVPCYLIPSPEVWMKRLIAQGLPYLFQLTKCFRNGESVGTLHNPEFTMCEWYTGGADYMDSIATTEEFFEYLYTHLNFKSEYDIRPPFHRLSMKQAFLDYCDIELDEFLSDPVRHPSCKRLSIDIHETSTSEEIFNKIFLTYIEPALPVDKPVILYDYPVCIPVLAKIKESGLYYERWELYIAGKEIGNCYSEETDPVKVEEFIKTEAKRKETAAVVPRIDKDFSTIFHPAYPRCSGVAIGIDRLFMVITGINSIEGVILFPFSSIMV